MTVLEFRKIVGTHKEKKNICIPDFILELSNGFCLSSGTDYKIYIYDNQTFQQLDEINTIKERAYFVCERKSVPEKTKIQYVCCSNKEIYLTEIEFKPNERLRKAQKYELAETTCTNCVEMKENHYAMVGLNGGYYYTNLFNKNNIKVDNHIITNKTYRGAIKIGEDLLALTSNSVAVNGEDTLVFYDLSKIEPKKKGRKYEPKLMEIYKDDYSFIFTNHGLALINFREDKEEKNNNVNYKNKILLCACKKYLSHQKNGILLVNIQLKEQQVKNPFYDTGDFEVYCFCPLFINIETENKEILTDFKYKETEYFLVGGFDNYKGEGMIKLYKILYCDKAYEAKIEYLQDIIFDRNKNFEGFKGAINCIIQTKNSENKEKILASCYDGNIYLLSRPNLEYYLKENVSQ